MSDTGLTLDEVRAQIDAIDRELVRLISDRARLAQSAARAKRAGEGDGARLYRPEREAQLLKRVARENEGPLGRDEVVRILSEIVSACRALELPLTVGYLGPEGTFTEAAALKHFGHAVSTEPLATIDAVFREVASGACDFGVVPVENSTEGVVSHTLDVFAQSSLCICGEIMLPIHHCLVSKASSLDAVERIYSHQQSFAQCRKWLDAHLPTVERVAVSSNAEAARITAEQLAAGAIAGKIAAEAYALPVLESNIEDEPDNATRFLVLGHEWVEPSGDDKTSVMFSFANRPGGLFHVLEVFARRGIDLTRIESRPSRLRRWSYVFHVDLVGHVSEPLVREALDELEQRTDLLKILGSFPRAPAEDRA